MTEGASPAPPTGLPQDRESGKTTGGLDPVIGLGLIILGVLVMGIAGASTQHYLFNAGTAIALLGAMIFVVAVALSALRETLAEKRALRRAQQDSKPPRDEKV
ncbi:MAG: hypothetical protein U0271_20810 [Polyangiaceae bacterium]